MRLSILLSSFLLAFLSANAFGQSVVYNPYQTVDWASDLRCNAQFHDHATTAAKLKAYDDDGYCFASYFNYSGNPTLDYAWGEYRWPVDDWLGPGVESSLTNLKLFPNVEQIGRHHWTSPWIESYVEYNPGRSESHHYDSVEEGFELARERGALPILAHPWGNHDSISGMHAVEIYNGYGLNKYLDGSFLEDLNDKLIPFWDRQLMKNPRLFGVAVNDWFGAFSHITSPNLAWAQDTGKQVLLVSERTSAAAKEAFRSGAMFALVDKGDPKDNHPRVTAIEVGLTFIHIDTDGSVRWISEGQEIATGVELDLSAVTGNYVRAEISKGNSVLYTQPWEVQQQIADCDFNRDGECNLMDIDSLTSLGNLVDGVTDGIDSIFDLTNDQQANTDDVMEWLKLAGEKNGFAGPLLLGDANLDGKVDQIDLNAVGVHWLSNAKWSGGDFNGDGIVMSTDLNYVGRHWLSAVPSVVATNATVPEPRCFILLVHMAVFAALLGSRRTMKDRSTRASPRPVSVR